MQNHLDNLITHLGRILNYQCMIEQLKKKENEWKEKVTLGWKSKKGSLKRKWEDFKELRAQRTKEWKVNNQEASEASTGSSIPSNTKKPKPSIQEFLPQIFKFVMVGLDACQIAIFRD